MLKAFFLKLTKTNYDRHIMFFVFDCDANGDFVACNNFKTNHLVPFIFITTTVASSSQLTFLPYLKTVSYMISTISLAFLD